MAEQRETLHAKMKSIQERARERTAAVQRKQVWGGMGWGGVRWGGVGWDGVGLGGWLLCSYYYF